MTQKTNLEACSRSTMERKRIQIARTTVSRQKKWEEARLLQEQNEKRATEELLRSRKRERARLASYIYTRKSEKKIDDQKSPWRGPKQEEAQVLANIETTWPKKKDISVFEGLQEEREVNKAGYCWETSSLNNACSISEVAKSDSPRNLGDCQKMAIMCSPSIIQSRDTPEQRDSVRPPREDAPLVKKSYDDMIGFLQDVLQERLKIEVATSNLIAEITSIKSRLDECCSKTMLEKISLPLIQPCLDPMNLSSPTEPFDGIQQEALRVSDTVARSLSGEDVSLKNESHSGNWAYESTIQSQASVGGMACSASKVENKMADPLQDNMPKIPSTNTSCPPKRDLNENPNKRRDPGGTTIHFPAEVYNKVLHLDQENIHNKNDIFCPKNSNLNRKPNKTTEVRNGPPDPGQMPCSRNTDSIGKPDPASYTKTQIKDVDDKSVMAFPRNSYINDYQGKVQYYQTKAQRRGSGKLYCVTEEERRIMASLERLDTKLSEVTEKFSDISGMSTVSDAVKTAISAPTIITQAGRRKMKRVRMSGKEKPKALPVSMRQRQNVGITNKLKERGCSCQACGVENGESSSVHCHNSHPVPVRKPTDGTILIHQSAGFFLAQELSPTI